MEIRNLENLPIDGKKIFLRLDLNVPINEGKITDETRIEGALATLEFILEKTNKVVVASHLGRPKGVPSPSMSLEIIGSRLAELTGKEVVFVDDYTEQNLSQVIDHLDDNQFILLENLRFHKEEVANDPVFSRELARHFDFYVNDAFGAAHRAHASTEGMAHHFNADCRAGGFLMAKEIRALSRLQSDPGAPFTVVMGGSKVSDKIGVTLNLLNKCNNLLIGGAMAYTFLKYKGFNVGNSRVEDDKMDLVEAIYRNAETRRVNIVLPVDHVGAKEFEASAKPVQIDSEDIPEGMMGLDIGQKTIEKYQEIIVGSKTVLWNGPMGVFEWEAYSKGSRAIAVSMAECRGETVVGGGDSVAAINMAGLGEQVSHISTGGGASLEFLEGKKLPGVMVLLG